MKTTSGLPALIVALLVMTVTGCGGGFSSPVSRYTITDLGSTTSGFNPDDLAPPDYNSYSRFVSINNHSQIAGTSSASKHAFLWSGGQMQDLGTLGGSISTATAINDSGQVVGSSTTPSSTPAASGDGPSHAFLYSNGAMQDLGTLVAGSESRATAINASGQIVGYSGAHAFLYRNGAMTDLGVLPGATGSEATSINAAGQIVGYSTFVSTTSTAVNTVSHAFVYTNGKMQDLGVPTGYTDSMAFGINDKGQIVGTLLGAKSEHLFLYTNGKMQDLGQFLTIAPALPVTAATASINNAGQIVVSGLGNGSTLLYSGGVLQDLRGLLPLPSPLVPNALTGINDAGQIVGTGTFNTGSSTGNFDGFLLSPQITASVSSR